MNRTIDDKTKDEMIEELKLEVESIQNELDNLVQELEQAEKNKKAILEIQDWMRVHLKFWPFERVDKRVN
tara:strand:- start:254 stop:463 length:210 start_codon:yes stop_codon:yes gene_type:complete